MINKLNFSQGKNIENPLAAFGKSIQDTGQRFTDRITAAEDREYKLKLREQAEQDRTRKLAELDAQKKFAQDMLRPKQVEGGLITDRKTAGQWDEALSFTPEENAIYTAAKGDVNAMPEGAAKQKALRQAEWSTLADTYAADPSKLESDYTRARRLANRMEDAPISVLDTVKQYELADLKAREARKEKGQTYLDDIAKLEAEKLELGTKIGEIKDKGLLYGTENAKGSAKGSGGGSTLSTKDLDAARKAAKEQIKPLSGLSGDRQDEYVKDYVAKYKTLVNQGVDKNVANEFLRSKVSLADQDIPIIGWDAVDIEDLDPTADAEKLKELKTLMTRSKKVAPNSNEANAIKAQIAALDAQIANKKRRANEYGSTRLEAMNAMAQKDVNDRFAKYGTEEKKPNIVQTVSEQEAKGRNAASQAVDLPMDAAYGDKVAYQESRSAKDPYKAYNEKSKAMGKYQMLASTLDDYRSKLKKGGVTNEEFMANPKLQEEAFKMHTAVVKKHLANNDVPVNDLTKWVGHNLGQGNAVKLFEGRMDKTLRNAIKDNLPKGVEPTVDNYLEYYMDMGNTGEDRLSRMIANPTGPVIGTGSTGVFTPQSMSGMGDVRYADKNKVRTDHIVPGSPLDNIRKWFQNIGQSATETGEIPIIRDRRYNRRKLK